MWDFDTTFASTMDTDTQHIARGLRQRDVALLSSLVAQYQYRLVRYLIYLLGSRELADDLVQETWLRVLERGRTYNPQSRFEPWLFAIARNLAIDSMRKRSLSSLDATGDDDQPIAESLSSGAPSPFEQAARTEDAQHLALALAALEPIYREALVLRFQEDLSLQEMTKIIGAPVSTVSTRIYRGLEALREHMEGASHVH